MRNRKWLAGGALVAVMAAAIALAPMATASDEPVASSVIAQDTTPAPIVAPTAIVVGVDANIPAGLTVNGSQGKPVTIATKGEKSRTAVSKPASPVVFRALTPGKVYTVSIAGKQIGTGTPVTTPTPAWGLTVATTGTPGSVALSWEHQGTRPQGTVTYTVTATPQGSNARTSPKPVTATTTTTSYQLDGLDSSVLYTFTVVPVNTAATGQGSIAVMNRTLAEIWGTPQTVSSNPVPAKAPVTAVPAPAPAPGPITPSTRTIYVCPAGFPESGSGVCEKTAAYTYTAAGYTYNNVGYTYHPEAYGSVVTVTDWCGYTNDAGGNPVPWCATHEEWQQQGTNQVKDAVPAGYTDTGSNWTKKNDTPAGYTDTGSNWTKKNDTPAGYTDNGTTWITTAAKDAQVVPA